jgi:hypothetical protein
MVEDTRLDSKLFDLARDLKSRPMLPGFQATDAFTMRGLDESGKPGMFAAVLLAPAPVPELETLTTIRQLLTQKLKQLDTTIPAWPIVVQGAPELISAETVVPGGREHFEELKRALEVRRQRARPSYTEVPVVKVAPVSAAPAKKAAPRKPAPVVKKAAQRRPAARRSVAR